MYELDRYIMLIRRTGFNPFRLAAAYASCSPPSPASGDGSYDDRAPARHFVLSFCAHTQRITEFAAKPRDFRMERHVLGSGRSVSGRRRGSPRRLRNVTLRRKAALFASEMTKNISNEFQKEIRLKIFRNKGFASIRSARFAVRKERAALFAPTMTKNILREFQFEIPLKIFRNKEQAVAVRKDKSTEKPHFSRSFVITKSKGRQRMPLRRGNDEGAYYRRRANGSARRSM